MGSSDLVPPEAPSQSRDSSQVASRFLMPGLALLSSIVFLLFILSISINILQYRANQEMRRRLASDAEFAKSRATEEFVIQPMEGTTFLWSSWNKDIRPTIALSPSGSIASGTDAHDLPWFTSFGAGFTALIDVKDPSTVATDARTRRYGDNIAYILCHEIMKQVLWKNPNWTNAEMMPADAMNLGIGVLRHPAGMMAIAVVPDKEYPERYYHLWFMSCTNSRPVIGWHKGNSRFPELGNSVPPQWR